MDLVKRLAGQQLTGDSGSYCKEVKEDLHAMAPRAWRETVPQ